VGDVATDAYQDAVLLDFSQNTTHLEIAIRISLFRLNVMERDVD
jgi:hypothetical protein